MKRNYFTGPMTEQERHEDKKRGGAFKRVAPIPDPVPYVATFTSAMKLKAAATMFGKRKMRV